MWFVACDPRPPGLAGPLDERDAAIVAPDRRWPEDVVPEGMVEVPVRVDDDRDRSRRQLADMGLDLAGLDVGGPGVDDERLAITQDDPDVLVVELVAADEEAVTDLDPAVVDAHGRMVSTGSDDALVGRVRCARCHRS